MHFGIANYRFPLKSAAVESIPGIPSACASRNIVSSKRIIPWSLWLKQLACNWDTMAWCTIGVLSQRIYLFKEQIDSSISTLYLWLDTCVITLNISYKPIISYWLETINETDELYSKLMHHRHYIYNTKRVMSCKIDTVTAKWCMIDKIN